MKFFIMIAIFSIPLIGLVCLRSYRRNEGFSNNLGSSINNLTESILIYDKYN